MTEQTSGGDDLGPPGNGTPSRAEVDAVMLGAQVMVAVTAQSVAAVESEVSLPQLRVLVILASRGPQSLNSVARSLEIHPSNATRACDRLVEAGLIRREADANDRRQLELILTQRGERLIHRVMDHRRKHVVDLLRQVPEHEREQLASTLRALASAVGETLEQAAWQSGWTTTVPVPPPGEEVSSPAQ